MSCRLTTPGFYLSLLFAMVSILSGCGGGGASSGTGTTTPPPTTSTAKYVALSSTATSVKTDNSDSVTLTATVVDVSNAALSGQNVAFQTSSGILGTATAVTDASGNAKVSFRSGSIEKTNRTVTITTTVSGTSATGAIPIQISGSTLTLASASSSVPAGTPAVLTATLKDAGTTPVPNQTVRFTVAASTGSGTLSAASGTTNTSGVVSVSFTGTAAGPVNILAEWLDSAGATSVSATQVFTVVAASTSVFQVTTPATSPFAVALGATQNIVVNVPAIILSRPVASIRYATTLGTWQANVLKAWTVPRTGLMETQVFVAGTNAGNANVQIDALDAAGAVITTAKLVLALSASAASATQITLQSNVAAIAPSSGGTTSTATLTATVRNIGGSAVGSAPVLFELVNPTGSGEQLDPVVVMTNSSGVALSTFTAGTASTVQSSQIRASVIGSVPVITALANITVGGTAGSIAIGTSSTIASVYSSTAYSLPVTVLVTDSNGNAVSGAVITLSVWPKNYYKGFRGALCAVTYVGTSFTNEDLNENLVLDPGEDIDGAGGAILTSPFRGPADNILWPPSSSAGSVPVTVTTGADGTATFNWVYLKQHADWIAARLRARTLVLGTEATSETVLMLSRSVADSTTPCSLSPSPFN